MNQQDDENYGYQEEDYGQDYYEEGQGHDAEGEYTEEEYADNQLPVQDRRSLFQKYSGLIIYGGIGVVIAVMGYINFGHLLFPADKQESQVTAEGLLNPDYGQQQAAAPTDGAAPPPDAAAAATGTENALPEMNAMGVSPAAPVTGALPDGGMALSPAAPPDPNDPWAEVAAAPPAATPAESAPPVVAAAPAGPETTLPEAGTPAPAATASVGEPVTVPAAEAEKLAEVQKKLAEAEAIRSDQEAAIAELQNKLAEAEARAAAPKAAEPAAPVVAEKPKPKKPAKPAAPKTVTSWELRSASDGMAWVTRPGDNQLFRITVGDDVPGIGRVTAIREQGGQWVVVGTEGQIRQ